MSLTIRLTLTAGLLSLAVLLLGGCPAGNGTGGALQSGGSGTSAINVSDPGIGFTKITYGLPARTLDYVGASPTALAGAPAGGKVFFGIENNDKIRLYSRDLDSGRRTYLTELTDFLGGSLVTDTAGRFLVYDRLREISQYIDDPFITFPNKVALSYRFDTETGETTELFDFRDNPWRAYRGDNHIPFISADGSTVYVLAYNIDWLALDSQLKEWLAIEGNYRESYDELTEDERVETEYALRKLYTTRHVQPLMAELDVAIPESGEITVEEHDAIAALERETGIPEAALLIWQDGETRLLPLKLDTARRFAYHYILAADRDTVLVVAPEQYVDQTALQPVYRVDMETGELSELATYMGAPSNYQLDAGGENLILAYNPIDSEAREILTETHIKVLPLDGGGTTDLVLEEDYMGLVGITSDYSTLVGQDRDDYDLYIVDTASGERRLLRKLLAGVDSIFTRTSTLLPSVVDLHC